VACGGVSGSHRLSGGHWWGGGVACGGVGGSAPWVGLGGVRAGGRLGGGEEGLRVLSGARGGV
jgi:hypothetical protein